MNLQDRIDPTVSEQCCERCEAKKKITDSLGFTSFVCGNPDCPCHSPSSGVESKNFFQYRADPNAKKLDKDFDPTVEPTAPVGGSWGSEWDKKWKEMLAHRLFHYYKDDYVKDTNHPKRDPNDEETRKCIEYCDSIVKELEDFIRQTIKNREREIAEGVRKLYGNNLIILVAKENLDALINKQ